jgi:hypothetical protein
VSERSLRQATQPTEVPLSSAQPNNAAVTQASGAAAVPMRLEVTTLPVADVDRARAFYERLGWRLDIDFKPSPDTRGVQFTPPGSPALRSSSERERTRRELPPVQRTGPHP